MVGRQKLGAGDLGLPFIALAENLPVDRNPAGVTQAGSIPEVATPQDGLYHKAPVGWPSGMIVGNYLWAIHQAAAKSRSGLGRTT